ncbi:LuxR C-terminal-related transcriptional regulator [Cupriavidus oxalaticus]|uniref:LuxR family transcriptional regulator n=1 Tax=Cupriavidus oxalaticus TaxID=96344 RepID=A0A4P7LHW4_9BURK|nr:LuxR C-terminal-related transcriptional regulator [Cupriavidus oxalaticus]QBY55385.1 LuxR family transcriptional regulator [Cupriavidus oxalaticus]
MDPSQRPGTSASLPASAAVGTKIVPPRGARRLMARTALTARLMELRRQRCVVLRARAGSGKTSTLLAWRQLLVGVGYDVSWLSLNADDNDWARFCDCILGTLAEVDPAITRDAAVLASPAGDNLAIERWILSLLGGVASRQRPLMIMIDDLQHLTHPQVLWALQCLIQYAPDHLHFAFGTRSALSFLPAHAMAQGLVSELGPDDLAFTATESAAFLQAQLGRVDQRDAEELHRMTEGWAAGLQLAALNLKAQRQATAIPVPLHDATAFSAYFESEVLARMSAADLALFTRMSVCNPVSASLCAALTGSPAAVTRTMTRLDRLYAQDLFITQIHDRDHETWYKLHPLLREVLQTRVCALPLAEQRELHLIAWRWFEQRGLIDEAVRHAVLAGEDEAAADLVNTSSTDLMARGELSRLSALLRLLPPEQIEARFGLRLASAYLLLPERGRDATARALAQFDAQIAAGQLNRRQRFSVTLLRASLALRSDDADAIAQLQPELQDVPADIDSHEQVLRDNVLAWMYVYRGKYALARERLEDHAHADGAPREHLIGRCLLAMSHAMEGRLAAVENILRPVLQEAEKRGRAYAGVYCMAATLLADAMYELNETDAVRALLESRLDVIERLSMPDTVMRALLLLTGAHWAGHRHLDAFACLDRLDDYVCAQDLERLRAYLLCARARLYLRAGEVDLADASLQRLDALAARYPDAGRVHAFDIWLNAERAHAELDLHRNAFDAARERLQTVVAFCERSGRGRRAVSLRLQLALAEQGCGRAEAAHDSLLEALRAGHRLGLMRTLLDVSPQVPALLETALRDQALEPVLAFYTRRLLDAAAVPPAPANASAGSRAAPPAALAALSEREREILELVAQAMPNKKIARALNITPETVKWHLKNAFSKLGVNGRDEAAERLRDLKQGTNTTASHEVHAIK